MLTCSKPQVQISSLDSISLFLSRRTVSFQLSFQPLDEGVHLTQVSSAHHPIVIAKGTGDYDKSVNISSFVVQAQFQGSGVGELLLSSLLATLKELCSNARLTYFSSVGPSLTFFTKFGFRVSEAMAVFEHDPERNRQV